MVQGLESGDADLDGDGQIAVEELYNYVYEHVIDETPKQTPSKWAYRQQGKIVIAQSIATARKVEEEQEGLAKKKVAVFNQRLRKIFTRGRIFGGLIVLGILIVLATLASRIANGDNAASVSATQSAMAIAAIPAETLTSVSASTHTSTPTHPLTSIFTPVPTSVPASAPIMLPTLSPAPTNRATSTLVPAQVPTAVPTPESTRVPTLEVISTRVSSEDSRVMIYVPAGEFTMGSNVSENEGPEHKVYVDAFWIDQTEVTNAMFREFVDSTSYRTNAEIEAYAWGFDPSLGDWKGLAGANWQHPRGPSTDLSGLDNHPVVQISWNDARTYCEWDGRRLPTEAEWEKAARGTDSRIYPWGNQNVTGDFLNFADQNLDVKWAKKDVDDGYQFTAPVGHYPDGASPYGAYDMAGNVREWVVDWYGENYYSNSPIRNPTGPTTGNGHILRGGGWNDGKGSVRVAIRLNDSPEGRSDSVGFRCVQSAK